MDQDRILGESTIFEVYTSTGLVKISEVDSVEETHQTDQKTTRPLGQRFDHLQNVHKGWELAVKGGKVDGSVSKLAQSLQDALLAGKNAPKYRATRTIEYFSGEKEILTYDNGKMYGFKESSTKSDEEVTWDFTFWAPKRKQTFSAS